MENWQSTGLKCIKTEVIVLEMDSGWAVPVCMVPTKSLGAIGMAVSQCEGSGPGTKSQRERGVHFLLHKLVRVLENLPATSERKSRLPCCSKDSQLLPGEITL